MTYKINDKYKDRIFRFVFREKKELLELYNAVNNSDYTNPEELEITTIEDVLYMGMKNDLSFIIGDVMNLYEHQGSYSPNLPLRGLFYFSSMYRAYIEPEKNKLYLNSKLTIPFPKYIVFYNGTQKEPEYQELKLSNLFQTNEKTDIPALECTAVVLNINYGHNKELMEKCKTLKEYAQLVAMIRNNIAKKTELEVAVEQAVDECITRGILSDILRKNRAEVIEMILTEYDEEEFRQCLKEESWKEGHVSGIAKEKIHLIRQMLKKKFTEADIVELLELDAKDIKCIIELIEENPEEDDFVIAQKSLLETSK